MPQIRLQNLHRTFDGGLIALDGIDLSIESGEFVAILGPSGSGKSTMLRIIAGLDRPTAGSAQVGNPGEKPQLAYVFQDAHLLPWRNVRRNVELPLELMGVSRPKRRDAAIEALASVGLADAARRYPNQLSGGMRMRVSIARAMVAEPKILLMDEPFAALDEITRHQLDDQLRQLWESRKITIIF
ncbi:MAG TPA: ATP-binding cassette domain-containing protein, partial [Tepidisphaeraceae bacterium]|nr:ATP-binding cassette domain-containing protein [Tepidisphaeraceae bacterium]